MKRECILSDTELNKKRKIIQKNKMKKILTEHNEMSAEEVDIMEQDYGLLIAIGGAFAHSYGNAN